MLGYAFMGKAHSNAFRKVSYVAWPPPLVPRLVAIAGRNEEAVAEAAQRYGWERWTSDWRDIVADPAIGLFDNGGPNSLHAEPTIAAAEAGKHVLCEKPLGRDADESYEIWQRVAATGVKHLCGFNYRFVPAVRLARELIEAGELGEIRHFRGRYLQDWGDDPTLDTWRFQPDEAGSGALGDLGTHVVDLARFLVGEIATVSGLVRTFLPGRRVDDALEAAVEFEQGTVGTIEATRLALGRRNAFQWEINGSKGSLAFDMERLNELQVFRADGDRARGFKTVLVSEADHPFWDFWWPPGHIIGWGDTFVHEVHHLLRAIAEDGEVAPYGATFEDGYRAAEVCDALVRSSETGSRVTVRVPLAARGALTPSQDGVERDGEEEDAAGRDEDRALRQVECVQAVRDRRNHERAEERVLDLAASAEQARAADHGRRDRVDQERAAAGVQVDAVQPGRQHDATEAGHRAGDHEDDDPDARDVDTCAPGGLCTAADGIDVPAERRSLGEEGQDEQHPDHQEQDEGDAAILVADDDSRDGGCKDEHEPADDQPGIAHGYAVAAVRDDAAHHARRVDGQDDRGNDPPGPLREEVVGRVVDGRILDDDHALLLDRFLDHPLPDLVARERDDERGHPDQRDERALEGADQSADPDCERRSR